MYVEIEQCWICEVFFRCQESFRDIIIYPHMKCHWNRTMLNLCGIVVAILKMANCPISSKFDMWVDNDVPNWFPTLKNFYRSPFSKWPPQYRTNSTLSDFNAISYVGRLWFCPVVPEIYRGQVHCPRKESRKRRKRRIRIIIIIILTRYDYNLTIMKSPKPATDNPLEEQFRYHQNLICG
jgi:hypothetical protein